MQHILIKRIGRTFRKNMPRYVALMLVIIMSIFMMVSITAAAETLMIGTKDLAEKDHLEDGQFTVLVPLSADQEGTIREKGITLEAMFHMDFQLEDHSTLRIFKMRKELDLIRFVTGRAPKKPDEVVLERRYCEEHGLKEGDVIQIAGQKRRICGIATSPDYEGPLKSMGDSTVDSVSFGVAWMSDAGYEELKKTGKSMRSEEYLYAYDLNEKLEDKQLKKMLQEFPFEISHVEDEYFQEFWEDTMGREDDAYTALDDLSEGINSMADEILEIVQKHDETPFAQMGVSVLQDKMTEMKDGATELKDGFQEFRDEIDPLIEETFEAMEIGNLESFIPAEENFRIGCVKSDQEINRVCALFAGAIIMVLFAYMIAIFVTHEIERDHCIIGTLYAMGITRRDLLFHYIMLPIITILISSILGLILGLSDSVLTMINASSREYYSFPELTKTYSPLLILYALIMPVFIAVVVNWIVLSKKLDHPPLKLIRNETKQNKIMKCRLDHLGYVGRFRIRQFIREFRSALTVVFGVFLSALLLFMGINCYALCKNLQERTIHDISFSYMYTYKYPEHEVPQGGTPACGETLKMESMGYSMDITLLGIEEKNEYFDLNLEENQSDVTISDSLATKFGLKEGDRFTMEDPSAERWYTFHVQQIIPYASGFFVFMDIGQMRELMDIDEEYFNIVFSNKKLDIPSGKLFQTVSSEDIIEGSGVFLSLMMPMIYTMVFVPAFIMVVVMYLMMRVMIDHSAGSIALFRIFGYTTGEIRKLYLDGNFIVVAVGAALCLPLAKWCMDISYPYLVSNVSCGIYLDFPFYYYGIIYAVILILYVLIDIILMRRIRKITPAKILANRE